jgi:hypothetical protein
MHRIQSLKQDFGGCLKRMRGNRLDCATITSVVITRQRVSPFGEPDDRLQRVIQYSRDR